MSLEHSDFWFLLIFGVGMFFVSLVILFGLQIAYSITIDDLEECIKQGIPPKLCIAMFYQPPLQGANWTVPFP